MLSQISGYDVFDNTRNRSQSSTSMIDFYTAATPNGQKVAIMLEEAGLAYTPHLLDFSMGDQRSPGYLAINPNGKIPAIVDRDGFGEGPVNVFESGAILIHLAEKSGQLLPSAPTSRIEVLQWLMFQMSGIGPTFGQLGYWNRFVPTLPQANERYRTEANRLIAVLDRRLATSTFLAGADYTIADVAMWPWVNACDFLGLAIAGYPGVERWHCAILGRPAVTRGMAIAPPPV